MNPLELVIAIVALSLIYKLIDTWVRQKARSERRADEAADGALQQRLADLEERVRVLERIVTDERFELKQQFKNLGG
jgi:hypothetical protein